MRIFALDVEVLLPVELEVSDETGRRGVDGAGWFCLSKGVEGRGDGYLTLKWVTFFNEPCDLRGK